LERMSLATLIISLGLLVDNGIVIAEDFKRRLEDGESRDQALRDSGRTLAIPLLTSSLTTIVVFLPLMLAEHVAGEYTRSISLVILITLLSSWVIALTVTPTLCHRFIAVKRRENKSAVQRGITGIFERMNRGYEGVLRRILRWRLLFLLLIVVLFAGAVFTLPHLPKKFFPDSDRTQILVYLDLPAGSSMRKTDAAIREISASLEDRERFPHVESFAAYGGFGGPRFVLSLTPIDPDESKGFIVLNIDGLEHMDPTIQELRAMFNERHPEVRARVTKMFLGPSDSTKIEIQVKGPDADFIYETADRIKAVLRNVPGAIDVKTDWENRITQIRVNVDQRRAKRAGVTSDDVAQSMESYFSGLRVSEFREGDDIFPIVVRAPERERFDLDRVRTVTVYSRGRKAPVPLMQVADVELVNNFSRIQRKNLFRTITVEAKNTIMTAEAMVPLIQPKLDEIEAALPPAHAIEYDGVIQESADAQAALSANAPLCLGLIVILMIAQFNSFRRAVVILLTVPLLLIGAVIGLAVMGANFGFMVTLGLYSLAGIIINNAIVLLDRIDMDRETLDDPAEAVISACVRRLRPIVMTTLTTILGLLPLILFRDALFYGMASVIAFGLAVGTVLTLGVTPVLYSLFLGVKSNGGERGRVNET
ncbi:MAG: efflux RND transporter permease subunit, partial [Desulfococcaceae bacterium]